MAPEWVVGCARNEWSNRVGIRTRFVVSLFMADDAIHAVTGAFGYSGKYIAQRLLERGRRVITLTGSRGRADPFEGRVQAFPFNFDHPEKLTETLRGVRVLYNTSLLSH